MKVVAGIDYSMTSPAICVHVGDEWSIENCKLFYLTKQAKKTVQDGRFFGEVYPSWLTDPHRYEQLSAWSLRCLSGHNLQKVYIEGYAFGATGRVFQIAENTGLLKYALWSNKIPYDVFAPSAIKKAATGKGNADKAKMLEAFKAETNIDIRKVLDITSEKQWNPISDLVDAYYICKLGFSG